MSDSCGYIALDHGADGRGQKGRIVVAFRGTYSLANTIVDLSTVPQEYVPYPGSAGNESSVAAPGKARKSLRMKLFGGWLSWGSGGEEVVVEEEKEEIKCSNCTVHSGFWQSWQNTRTIILPHLELARLKHPSYALHLVGHSLGGAVAALAGLEMDALKWDPTITTFGEPKIGNDGLRTFIDARFGLSSSNATNSHAATTTKNNIEIGNRYRRVTHVDDPVPLLPLSEWGYKPHAGEIFISKSSLQPSLLDLHHCTGDEDQECSAAGEAADTWVNSAIADALLRITTAASSTSSPPQYSQSQRQSPFRSVLDPPLDPDVTPGLASDLPLNIDHDDDLALEYELATEPREDDSVETELRRRWGIPISSRYKLWQLFFAHRDYFWRLGLCVKGGDPSDWGRDKYRFPGDEEVFEYS